MQTPFSQGPKYDGNNVSITGGSISGITDLAVADGGTGASDAATAFGNIKQAATDSATGVVELATDAETVTGTDTERATTPANLTAKMAAPGAIGATTAGTLRSLALPAVHASSGALTANECADGLINNYGQAGNVTLTLPACAAGMRFRFIAGSTAAFYLRFDPDASDKIYLDGVASTDGKYVGLATVTIGDSISFEAFQTGASAYDWNVTSGIGPWTMEA